LLAQHRDNVNSPPLKYNAPPEPIVGSVARQFRKVVRRIIAAPLVKFAKMPPAAFSWHSRKKQSVTLKQVDSETVPEKIVF
jgi:hypothetical protein